jgi:hypothetical protein
MTWWCISPEITVMGFKKCYLSNAVDETDRFALGLSPYGPNALRPYRQALCAS